MLILQFTTLCQLEDFIYFTRQGLDYQKDEVLGLWTNSAEIWLLYGISKKRNKIHQNIFYDFLTDLLGWGLGTQNSGTQG